MKAAYLKILALLLSIFLLSGLAGCAKTTETVNVSEGTKTATALEDEGPAPVKRNISQEQIDDYVSEKNELFVGLTEFYAQCYSVDDCIYFSYIFNTENVDRATVERAFDSMCEEGPLLIEEAQYYAPDISSVTIQFLSASQVVLCTRTFTATQGQ